MKRNKNGRIILEMKKEQKILGKLKERETLKKEGLVGELFERKSFNKKEKDFKNEQRYL